MKESLDQERARFAWEKVQRQTEEYTKLAKGAPALIMQSGLMPVLAFFNEKARKNSAPHRDLLEHLCHWLQRQFNGRIEEPRFRENPFQAVMQALMGTSGNNAPGHAQFYRMATEEVLSILRWIRQFAAAVGGGNEGGRANG
ncbi:MAG: type III-B CRISPR module-associated protein Cmr5 [Deltaproteobacteria bacterium]|nr:type III-B CRISPR module-associated protein Cmr5 [Deltaproteobacteria bacterium]